AVHDHHGDREEDLVAKIFDLEEVLQIGEHSAILVEGAVEGAVGRSVGAAAGTEPAAVHRLADWLPLTAGRPALFSPLKGRGMSVTVPPAAVIAASAAFDTAWALTSSLVDTVPRARILTNALERTTPAFASDSGDTTPSRRSASSSSVSRLT